MEDVIKKLLKITLSSFFLVGYVSCIIKFFLCDFESPYKGEALYGIGVFTGLGIILGWFKFGR